MVKNQCRNNKQLLIRIAYLCILYFNELQIINEVSTCFVMHYFLIATT